MAALRIWWLPALMGVGQLLAWPIGPRLAGRPPSALDAAVAVVVTAVVAVALGWRRRTPEVALAVIVPTLVAGTIALPRDALSVIAVGDLVALFSLAVLRPARVVAVAVGLLLVGWTAVLAASGTPDPLVIVPLVAVIYVLVAALGRRRGRWQRARAAAAARLVAAEAQERRAAEVERDRLARELHDVTAHHLTAIVVHANAARRLGPDRPELTGETLSFAADTGRRTLTALDRLVTVIEPVVEPLPARLARVAAVAPDVSLTVTGPVDGLPAAVADAVLAVVQEGVTNAMRYAAGAPVTASVETAAHDVRVTVVNPAAGAVPDALAPLARAPGLPEAPPSLVAPVASLPALLSPGDAGPGAGGGPLGSGRGLAGLAARARELGGTFETGPGARGGWRVAAVLPLPVVGPVERQMITSERIVDGALTALALLPPVLVLIAAADAGELRDVRVGVLLALLALLHGAPVWWRRMAPWPALAAVLGAALAHAVIVAVARLPVEASWPLFAGLYAELITVWAVATYAVPAVVGWTAALAAGGVWSLVVQLIGDGDQATRQAMSVGRFAIEVNLRALVFTAVLLVPVWALAAALRRRRERTLEAEASALRAAAARAAAAAREQRARFAAGLHASVLGAAQRLIAAAEGCGEPQAGEQVVDGAAVVVDGAAVVVDGAGRRADGAAVVADGAGLAAYGAGRMAGGGGLAAYGAGRMADGAGLAAIDRVAAEARAGLAAMRELLGVLQPAPADDPGTHPRGVADLADLCAERRVNLAPAPAPAPYPLPVAVDVSGYRIVEVALETRDAGAASVLIEYPGGDLSVTVTGVPGATTGIPAARIQARVAALGGRVRFTRDGVTVHLPAQESESWSSMGVMAPPGDQDSRMLAGDPRVNGPAARPVRSYC